MALATWLKRTQLKRVERKLRRFRARLRQIRDKETQLKKDRDRGALQAEDYKRREKELHDEHGVCTREINHLMAEEERLKAELRAAGESATPT